MWIMLRLKDTREALLVLQLVETYTIDSLVLKLFHLQALWYTCVTLHKLWLQMEEKIDYFETRKVRVLISERFEVKLFLQLDRVEQYSNNSLDQVSLRGRGRLHVR